MKKFFIITAIILISSPSFAVNFGTYKTETDYGLIDGFKWNFFNREKGQPLVQLKSEIKEEQVKLEKEKSKPVQDYEEVQMYRFMLDDVVAF